MATQTKPKSFSKLYTAIKYHPEYKEWEDANKRKHNNAEEIIPGWIWECTNEEKWRKRDLTMEEFNKVVNDLYTLSGKKPRTVLKKEKGIDEKDDARKALIAAWHKRLELLHDNTNPAYLAAPTGYVISCIMRTCGDKYKDINDIPLWELRAKYHKICADNKVMENAIRDNPQD